LRAMIIVMPSEGSITLTMDERESSG
jgi:hypothetical protein